MPRLLVAAPVLLLACHAASEADDTGHPVRDDTGTSDWTPTDVPHAAAFVEQQVPTSVTAGEAFQATVTMRNLGTAPWSRADGYFLGSAGPTDNFTWGTNRGWMAEDEVVAQGDTTRFVLDLVAPAAPGPTPMQWQMLQDGVEWFGETSAVVEVEVQGPDEPWAHADPADLRAFRGSIATTFAPVPCGPRPGAADNPVFTAMYDTPCWSEADRTVARDALHAHGYTHWPIGPIVQRGYHGYWPDTDWRSDPDAFLDRVEELWSDGFVPVVFLLPDTGDCADGSSIDHDCVERELGPIYASARFQALARVVVLAWEPDYSAADWQWGVEWMARTFPDALRYIHFTSGHGAPGRGSELEPDGPYANEAAMWAPVAPYVHGLLAQATWTFGGATDEGRTPVEQFSYDLWDLVRRFDEGYAGWPTEGAGGEPVDVVAYEYASYYCFDDRSRGTPDEVAAEAIEWGRAALAVKGVAGFGDGGP